MNSNASNLLSQILIYYDIDLVDIAIQNMMQLMEEEPSSELSETFGVMTANYNANEKRKFIHWCLYGNHNLR